MIVKEQSNMRAWQEIFRKYWLRFVLVALGLAGLCVAAALKAGMQKSRDMRASALFAQAKTVEDYQAILKQVPKSYLTADILLNIANLYYQQGDAAKAREYYQKVQEADPQGLQGEAAKLALNSLALSQQKD